jgi:hypothetical protein
VAATAAVDDDEAERRLAILASVNLLEPTARPGHWRMRALVLDDARRRADADLTGQARQEAADRAIRFQLRKVRRLRAEIESVDAEKAARLQAELEQEYAKGAALVDRAVLYKLKLAQLLSDELVDVFFDLVTVWPDLRRSREAVRWVLRSAAQADAPEIERRETEQRAREWLESQPDPPATDGIASQLLVHAPTRAELRAQFALHVQADAASRTIEALDGDQLLRQERWVEVEGWKFQPGEGIQISVDGVPSGGATADQSGHFVTTAWFFSDSPQPRVTLYGDLSGRVDPK